MELVGEVGDIIYYNETNSYMIAEFDTEEEQTTIVGYMPFVSSADNLKIIGNFVEHKKYDEDSPKAIELTQKINERLRRIYNS